MKKIILYITIILLADISSSASTIDLTKWEYLSRIAFDGQPGEYAKADIIPEVYNVAKLDMSDIRIVNSDGQQVPYLFVWPNDVLSKHKYLPNIINRSTDDENNSLVTLDFGQQRIKNLIEVETAGSNFRRAVKVEGSNDNVAFFTLVEQAFLFAIDNEENSRFSTIDLSANDYRYLRITVEPMADEKKSPVIKELRAFNFDKRLVEGIAVETLCVNHEEDGEKNLSIYEYDLKCRNLPINEIKLTIADESFYRHITIEGRNAATRKVKIDSEDNRQRYREVEQSWDSVISGTVYRYISADGSKKERTTLSIPAGKQLYRYLKIVIRNYDDRPLELETTSAKMVAHQIIFDIADGTDISLYVGSESAIRPKYDIAHKLNNPREVAETLARLGAITKNPLFGKVDNKPQPWTERHKVLLLVIMTAVVLALGGFIFKSFKSIQSNQPQGG